MSDTSMEQGGRFYAKFADTELGGLRWDYGISAVLMELDSEGSVRRFVCVDDADKPLSSWPSRRPPPFMFCDGMFSQTSVFKEDRISAAEFEAKWAEAAALDEGR